MMLLKHVPSRPDFENARIRVICQLDIMNLVKYRLRKEAYFLLTYLEIIEHVKMITTSLKWNIFSNILISLSKSVKGAKIFLKNISLQKA